MIFFTISSAIAFALLFMILDGRNLVNLLIKFTLFVHTVWAIILSVKLSGIMDA